MAFEEEMTCCGQVRERIILKNKKTSKVKISYLCVVCNEYLDEKNIYDLEYFNTFINNIEKRVREIKEKNQFIIPDIIRKRYAKLYDLNVFSLLIIQRVKSSL